MKRPAMEAKGPGQPASGRGLSRAPGRRSRLISSRFLGLWLSALLLSALFSGCGVKTHPWPEMVTLPAKVENLAQTLDSEGHLWLSWSAPMDNVAGRPLQTLDHFEVWGADYDLAAFCQGCPVRPVKLADVFLAAPPPGLAIAKDPYVWETDVRPGRVYVFRVAGFSSRGAVNPAAWTETVVWSAPPPGPLQGFSAAADDLSVILHYAEPGGDLSVEVQRRKGSGPWEALDPLMSKGLDTSVAYGQSYAYRARLVRTKEGTKVPGPWTTEIALAIEDTLPPPPPGHLDAALSPSGVRLVWESLAEQGDVAGYKVYRSEEGSGWRLMGSMVPANSFLDSSARTGKSYRYRVTAVDTSSRANESAPSPEAEILSESPSEAAESQAPRPPLSDPGI